MTKHQWRHQVKSFFEKHVDQDKHEQLKETRKDMEDKKEKIIHLINGEKQDGSNGQSESLEKLVKDYHKQYESLYELYHNLTGEMKKKVSGRNEEDKEKFSSSSSDSDSDVDHSSKGKGGKNGVETDELKVKLESSTNLEIEELEREKSILIEEKDGAIKRAEEAEANVVELKDTVDGLKNEMKALEEQETALRLQLDMANNHKRETEEQLEIKAREAEVSNEKASRLKAEIEALTAQINGLEKEAELLRAQKSELEEELINKSGEASDQMKEVFDQLNSFQKELMTLATLKAEMEPELERKSEEVSECLTQLGNLTEKLANSESETTGLKQRIIDLELNLRSAERKAEELGRGNESNDQILVELQTTIEDLKRDIEMDKDELMTIEEKNRNLEVMLRLSNQKLRVTEQLLSEKEEKTAALSQTVEAYSDMIREISEQANASLAALDRAITEKFDEGLAKRVLSLSEEVRSVKSWVVETRLETERVKAEGVVMRERIEKMEMEAEKEKVEKEEVVRMVSQLDKDVKEKEERLLGLGDEKREAIKQLCVWIEYHRSRCVELRGILLKMAPRVQRTS